MLIKPSDRAIITSINTIVSIFSCTRATKALRRDTARPGGRAIDARIGALGTARMPPQSGCTIFRDQTAVSGHGKRESDVDLIASLDLAALAIPTLGARSTAAVGFARLELARLETCIGPDRLRLADIAAGRGVQKVVVYIGPAGRSSTRQFGQNPRHAICGHARR